MRLVSDLKGVGYLTSTASVLLLGAVSWQSAAKEPLLLACLLAGILLSFAGMMLRWRSHRLEQKQKDKANENSSPPSGRRCRPMTEEGTLRAIGGKLADRGSPPV